jgi:hypothetical protein
MKIRTNSVLKIFIGLGLLYLIFTLGVVFILFGGEAKKAIQRQERLLCETDHQALMEACREISRMFTDGELKKYQYQVRNNPDPEISSFPQVILDLEPTYINLHPGCVTVELCGGLDHFGVYAYTEDFKPPVRNYYYGGRELVPGLWYYDDGYENNPEYDKTIEALIQKRKESN